MESLVMEWLLQLVQILWQLPTAKSRKTGIVAHRIVVTITVDCGPHSGGTVDKGR
jgi:hypothetical protein